MTMRWALLLSTLFLGQASTPAPSNPAPSNPPPSNADFLATCWGAVAKDGGEYELSFEAVSFFGLTEGGISVPSTRCPDARMRFSYFPDEIDERFRHEEERGGRRFGRAGLRGRARVVPVQRGSEFLLRVRVTRLLSLERMSDEETRAFLDRHDIG
jgi:hypothetical protein